MKHGFEIIDARVFPPLHEENDCSIFGHTSEAEFMQTLKDAGITRCAGPVVSKTARSWAEIHTLNIAAFIYSTRTEGFYTPAIQIHPDFPEESLAEVKNIYEQGNLQLLEGIPANSPVWAFAAEQKIAVSLPLSPDSADVDFARQLLEKFPELKLILCGPGPGKEIYTARLELVKQYPHAALDLSGRGCNTWGMLRYGIDLAGKDKILFATGFPARNVEMYIGGVLFENLSEEEKTAVFSGNFKRLTGESK